MGRECWWIMSKDGMGKAIVTGGTGMLALALERVLVRRGVSVTLVVRPDSPRIAHMDAGPDTQVVLCDISNLGSLKKEELGSFDSFYHFAWGGTYGSSRDDGYMQNDNVRYTLDAVALAEELGCGVFVGAGSQAEYGRVDGVIAPETPTRPESGYGMAKLAAGGLSRLACRQKGVRQVWGRVLSLYGQGDNERTMMASCIRSLVVGERMSFTKGEQPWDYLHCDDAAEAFYRMGLSGQDGATYVVASGSGRTLAQYITAARDVINPDMEVGIGELPSPEGTTFPLRADITSLQRDTGFAPVVDFEEGVRRTAEWLRDQMVGMNH